MSETKALRGRTARKENAASLVLAGNPNVGKSTVFNCLTGMHQHTGNWAGKTVASAEGRWRLGETDILLVDAARLLFSARLLGGRGGGQRLHSGPAPCRRDRGLRRHLSGAQSDPRPADPQPPRRRCPLRQPHGSGPAPGARDRYRTAVCSFGR